MNRVFRTGLSMGAVALTFCTPLSALAASTGPTASSTTVQGTAIQHSPSIPSFAKGYKPASTSINGAPAIPGVAGGAFVATSSLPTGLADCTEYYHFGSTPVSLTANLAQVSQGSMVHVTGTITNENDYPILDAAVYIKLMDTDVPGSSVNGPRVVDWLVPAQHINLKPLQSQTFSFDWTVPQNAPPGNYAMASYVASSDRFNLFGLTFTDDVTGSTFNFKVTGADAGTVFFDKDNVSVNGVPFFFAAAPPIIPAGAKDLTVAASIKNTTQAGTKGTLVWQLYSWDSLLGSNLLDTQTQEVKVQPGDVTPVTYTVKDTSHAVYYLVGTYTSGDMKSIIGVRFVRMGNPVVRLNFVGVTGAPGQNGGIAFACIQSTTGTLVQDGRLTLTVQKTGLSGLLFGMLGSATYSGLVPGQLSAVTIPLTNKSGPFSVTATLYQGNKVVDQVTENYGCSLWQDSGCESPYIAWGIVVIVVLLVGVAGYVLRRRMRAQELPPNPYA